MCAVCARKDSVSSKNIGNGFILSEKFAVAALPEDPTEPVTWWAVDLLAQVRPCQDPDPGAPTPPHGLVVRPCVYDDRSGQSDTSDGCVRPEG